MTRTTDRTADQVVVARHRAPSAPGDDPAVAAEPVPTLGDPPGGTFTPRLPTARVRHRAAVVAVLLAAVVAVLALTASRPGAPAGYAADGHDGSTTTGHRSGLADATAFEVTIPPGEVVPWHTHPGPVLLDVVEGTFVHRTVSDCLDREYGPGEALVADDDAVHTAYNPGDTDTRVVATLLGVRAAGPLTVPAPGPDPGACALPEPQAYEAPWLLHPLQ